MQITHKLNEVAYKKTLSESWPERMTKNELRRFIDGCNDAREYDSYYEAACKEWNTRYR